MAKLLLYDKTKNKPENITGGDTSFTESDYEIVWFNVTGDDREWKANLNLGASRMEHMVKEIKPASHLDADDSKDIKCTDDDII